MVPKKVAVIGAGVCGLTAIKCCLEEEIGVVCFEKTGDVGGLWRYKDDGISVMKITVINTDKELSAFSDFPPPKEFPLYLRNQQMLQYFESYAEKFRLYPHIKFNTEVVKVVESVDYNTSGKWRVTVKDENGRPCDSTFDGVLVCNGHHTTPKIPSFPGQDKYLGRILHTQDLKSIVPFTCMTVLVVGTGSSGIDAATWLSTVTKQVYLSTRRGSWIVPKTICKGLPTDATHNTRAADFLIKTLGFRISSRFLEYEIDQRFNHDLYGLKPKHRILSQHPTMSDTIFSCLASGSVILKKDVERFTEKGVVFENENTETLIDAVVFGSGYYMTFPFLKGFFREPIENNVDLYKYTFPPDLKHPTLAFVGLVQPFGCIFPIAEQQCRWYALLLNGKVKLPSSSTMRKRIKYRKSQDTKRYVHSSRHTVDVDFVDCMDRIAVEYGVKPNLFQYFFIDPMLFFACVFGPGLSYQYRLRGPHAWQGARAAILEYKSRMVCPMSGGKSQFKYRYIDSLKIYIYFLFRMLMIGTIVISVFYLVFFLITL